LEENIGIQKSAGKITKSVLFICFYLINKFVKSLDSQFPELAVGSGEQDSI